MGLTTDRAGALAKAVTDDTKSCSMPEQLRPRGATMRDCLKNRAGYDRVLMAVAATFLTVSATSALAQANPARNSAAELAIDAAIPRPDPVNLPPVSINDFKPDTAASVPEAAATVPAAAPAAATATPSVEPAAQPTKAASTVAPADQPVADKLRHMLGTKSPRYFD